MKNKLKVWLKNPNRNYKEGVVIFKTLKVNVDKNNFFDTEMPSVSHKGILFNELARYNRVYCKTSQPNEKTKDIPKSKLTSEINEKIEAINKEISLGRIIIDKNPHVNYDDLPVELQKAYNENGKNYALIKTLHAKMKALPDNEESDIERKNLLTQIISLQKIIRANWDKIDDWAKDKPVVESNNPTLPSGKFSLKEIEKIADPEVKALSKKLRIDADLNYIRRYKNSDKRKKEVEKRIKELNIWQIDYEKRIRTNND